MTVERITSRRNPLLQHVKKLFASHAYREACGEFAGDGRKLLAEAARWAPELRTVIASDGVELCPLPEGTRLVRVPPDVMESVSPMRTPQGALFVCALPSAPPPEPAGSCLILDGVQDPGNLGTILRTADALEIPVLLAGDCADPYGPKTVRASMGAIFRAPPRRVERQAAADWCRGHGIALMAAALTPAAEDIRNVRLDRAAVIIGSEGQGVSDEFLQLADRSVIIPMNPRCESLNAATAATIVLWQMKLAGV